MSTLEALHAQNAIDALNRQKVLLDMARNELSAFAAHYRASKQESLYSGPDSKAYLKLYDAIGTARDANLSLWAALYRFRNSITQQQPTQEEVHEQMADL
jgi:hypothetical protein